MEPPFSYFSLYREALFIICERFGEASSPSKSVTVGRVTVIKMMRASLILKHAALSSNVGLQIACFLQKVCKFKNYIKISLRETNFILNSTAAIKYRKRYLT